MNFAMVYSFTVWNQGAGEQQVAPRKATREAISQIGGKVLEETEEVVDLKRVDGNGFLKPINEGEIGA